MRTAKWIIILTFWTAIAAFFHYTLPQKDIVRIVRTYEERQQVSGWTMMFWSQPRNPEAAVTEWDVQFIQAVRPDGSVMVYRNEDTGWGWPPYFKFDTANLYTEASDVVSTKDNPEWVLLTHYGWRNEFLSIFPNAISIRPVAGPAAAKPLPWLNVTILTIFAAMIYGIWVRWRRFRRARLDPKLDDLQDRMEAAGDAVAERGGRLRRWLGSR